MRKKNAHFDAISFNNNPLSSFKEKINIFTPNIGE